MNLSEYQKAAFFTAKSGVTAEQWVVGLLGEFGEVAEAIKKRYLRDNPNFSNLDIADEVGDLLWYICAIHTSMNEWVNEPVDTIMSLKNFDVVDWVLRTGHQVGLIAGHFSQWSQEVAGSNAGTREVRWKLEGVISNCLTLLTWLDVDLETVLERNICKLRVKYSSEGYVTDRQRLASAGHVDIESVNQAVDNLNRQFEQDIQNLFQGDLTE